MSTPTLSQRWNRFWFSPADARTLGFARMLVLLGAFLFYRRADFESWGFVGKAFWEPLWIFKHLHLHPMGPLPMWGAGFLWKLLLLTGGIGLFTRASCAGAFVLGVYLLGLPNNLGKVDHSDAIVLWTCLVMAVARSGEAWSIDALVRAARAKIRPTDVVGPPGRNRPLPDSEYRWPLRTLQVLMVWVFFASGTSKLRHAGLAWCFSDNLRNTFLSEQYLGKPWVSWGVWIAGHPQFCIFVAVCAVLLELSTPLTLFSRTARCTILPCLFLMQVGNELLLGINFRQFMLCYAFWVDWVAVGRGLRSAIAGAGWMPYRATVLFDGSCGLCTHTAAVLRRLDLLHRIEILDVLNDWEQAASRFPQLTQDECLRQMYVVDERGHTTAGFEAYRFLARRLPAGWPLLPLLYLPGVPAIGHRVYQRVAANRFRHGCGIDNAATVPATAG